MYNDQVLKYDINIFSAQECRFIDFADSTLYCLFPLHVSFSKNVHELCAFWTSVGECESNRKFMLEHCPAACRLCLLSNINMIG